jgi:hypothetical protein
MNLELEACVAHLQATADELAAQGADYGTIAKALVEVIAQIADEDRITAEVFLEIVASLLNEKIIDAGTRGDRYELDRYLAATRKPTTKPATKQKKKKKKK